MIKQFIQWSLSRYVVVYLFMACIAMTCVDWPAVHYKRERYLLGLFYNGYFTNCRDGLVYRDYVRRVFPGDETYKSYMKECVELKGP